MKCWYRVRAFLCRPLSRVELQTDTSRNLHFWNNHSAFVTVIKNSQYFIMVGKIQHSSDTLQMFFLVGNWADQEFSCRLFTRFLSCWYVILTEFCIIVRQMSVHKPLESVFQQIKLNLHNLQTTSYLVVAEEMKILVEVGKIRNINTAKFTKHFELLFL